MIIILPLTRDSDNSHPTDHLEVGFDGQSEEVSLKITGDQRGIAVKKDDLLRAVRAIFPDL